MADRPAELLTAQLPGLDTGGTPSKTHPRTCAATLLPTVTTAGAILPKIIKKRSDPSRQDIVDFSYPPEVEQFRKELRAWLAANLTDEVVAAGRRRGRDPETFVTLRGGDAKLADAGWGAVSWPQEYGGRGATVLEQLAYAEETIHARAPVPLNVIGMNNIAPAIMQFGTDSQKRELLPRMVRADDIWCQGM